MLNVVAVDLTTGTMARGMIGFSEYAVIIKRPGLHRIKLFVNQILYRTFRQIKELYEESL